MGIRQEVKKMTPQQNLWDVVLLIKVEDVMTEQIQKIASMMMLLKKVSPDVADFYTPSLLAMTMNVLTKEIKLSVLKLNIKTMMNVSNTVLQIAKEINATLMMLLLILKRKKIAKFIDYIIHI